MAHALRSRGLALRTRPTTRRKLPALLCALAAILSLALSACNAVPPHNDLCNSSSSGDAAPTPEPPHEPSQPVAADGIVYVGYALPESASDPAQGRQRQYVVAAVRMDDGATLWRVPAANGAWPQAVNGAWPLAVAEGVLIVLDTGASGLVGLRARDGAALWHAPLVSRVVTSYGGVLYVIANGAVYALRVADGRTLWHTPVKGNPVLTAPVVDGHAIYVASGNGSVVALRMGTGAPLWTSFPDPLRSSQVGYYPLAAAAGQLYVTTSGLIIGSAQTIPAGVLRLNPANGATEGYALRLPPYTEALYPALMASVFYAILLAYHAPAPKPPPVIAAYRLSESGSHLLWRAPVESQGFAPVLVAHDTQTLYLEADPLWVIFAYRLSDGAVLWRQRAPTTGSAGLAAASGYLAGVASGAISPCRDHAVDQAPTLRAFRSADGSIAWTRALDATL
jgi:putative pyrroloquinoline-quinone binding quinoprotein